MFPKKGGILKKLITLMFISVLFIGCATSYKDKSFFSGGGYSETQLDKNVFNVTFKGNKYTDRERASDLTLLRSAELTLENGFEYFIVRNSDNYSNKRIYTTPISTKTVTGVDGVAKTTVSGGNVYSTIRPSSSNTIVCFISKPKNVFSYNAKFIYNSIAKKYEIKRKPWLSE